MSDTYNGTQINSLVKAITDTRREGYKGAVKALPLGGTTVQSVRKYLQDTQIDTRDVLTTLRQAYFALQPSHFKTADVVLSGIDGGEFATGLKLSEYVRSVHLANMGQWLIAGCTSGYLKDLCDEAYGSGPRGNPIIMGNVLLTSKFRLESDKTWRIGDQITETLSRPDTDITDLCPTIGCLVYVRNLCFSGISTVEQENEARRAMLLVENARTALDIAWTSFTEVAADCLGRSGGDTTTAVTSAQSRSDACKRDQSYSNALEEVRISAGSLVQTWMRGIQRYQSVRIGQ